MKAGCFVLAAVLLCSAPAAAQTSFDPIPEPATPKARPGTIGGALSLNQVFSSETYRRRKSAQSSSQNASLSVEGSLPDYRGLVLSAGAEASYHLARQGDEPEEGGGSEGSAYLSLSTALDRWRFSLTAAHYAEDGRWSEVHTAEREVYVTAAYVMPVGDGSLSPSFYVARGFAWDGDDSYVTVGPSLSFEHGLWANWHLDSELSYYYTRYDHADGRLLRGGREQILEGYLAFERDLGHSLSLVLSLLLSRQWSPDPDSATHIAETGISLRYLF